MTNAAFCFPACEVPPRLAYSGGLATRTFIEEQRLFASMNRYFLQKIVETHKNIRVPFADDPDLVLAITS